MGDPIDATGKIVDFETRYDDDATPTIVLLQKIADEAQTLITGQSEHAVDPASNTQIEYLNIDTEADIAVSSLIEEFEAPETPDIPTLFQEAIDYLDYLKSQTLVAATFPDYDTIVTGEPTSPTLDDSDPEFYTIIDHAVPDYEIPVWDDSSAWSGGDVGSDATVAALVKPFTWTGSAYSSELLVGGNNVLYDAIIADIQSSDYGISTLDDGRLWDRQREREDRQTAQAVGDAISLFSSGGFSAPTGAAQAAINRANNEGRDRSANANRDISATQAALYLEAKKFAYSSGLQIETLEQGFFNAENDRLLRRITQEITSTVEVAAYNVSRILMHVEKYAAFARVFESRVNGARGTVDLYSAQVNSEGVKAGVNRTLVENLIAKNQNLINIYNAQIEGFKSVVDGRVRYHNVLADVFKTETGNTNQHMQSVQGAYDLAESQHKNQIDFAIGKYNAQANAARVKLEEVTAFLGLKIEQLKSQAQSASSIAAAAISALNVNLGLSLSGSAGLQGSESHAYDQTKGINAGDTTSNIHQYDETKSQNPGTITQEIDYTSDNTSENTNYNYQGEI